ncbi:MAG: hypothetical protein WCN95_14120, partial [bacterium]
MRHCRVNFFLVTGLLLLYGVLRSGICGEPALEPPLQKLREQAQQYYDAGDTENGHKVMATLVAAIPPGRVELAAELLGTMRRASMADRRMNRWTEYAAERLVALHQAGLLDQNNPEVPAAYDCLCVVRWDQGRLWESWSTLQLLLELELDNPYARLGPVRLLSQVESTKTIPLMLSILDKEDASVNNGQMREWLMVADRIMSDHGAFVHTPLLDPFRPAFSRAKFWDLSNQQMLYDLKRDLARRLTDQSLSAPATQPPASAPV